MISIIIPVYNVEKYIDQCLESIISQTYKDWECVLINDGSTDSSGYLCNLWAQKDKRIHVIHQKNSGVSIARNNGLKRAKGDYICFIDSDDWIEYEYLEILYKFIENSDLVVSGIIRNYCNNYTTKITPLKTETFNLENTNIHKFVDLNNKSLLYAPHEKIYKSIIIKENNITFIENCNYGEDLLFNYQYLQHVHTISTLSIALYHYRILSNTLSTKLRKNQFKEDYFQWLVIRDFHKQRDLLDKTSLEYLYKRLWGIIYDGLFLYPRLNIKSINYIYQILSIIEIKELKKYKNIFPCSKWIKNAIINRNAYIFYIYFTFLKKRQQ